ncbi:hypothetical protein [Affinirhizobium pseudoryzae]|uniref:hypothetical protein n=1 Tax=Allorhizobium pseudoryzae TaxID=379684 RepID=UPI0019D03978|nr:hypothetical protein [Allorhizobium pseudoryzae]
MILVNASHLPRHLGRERIFEGDFFQSLEPAGLAALRALARLAGKTTSPAKAAAARANGSNGGRPRKLASG